MNTEEITPIITFRRELHRYPSLSGNEEETAAMVARFLKGTRASKIMEGIGGKGVIAVYEGRIPGPAVLLRAELDALPIQEELDVDYKSVHEGVSHKCGHDGHMAILAGIASLQKENPIQKGKLILLFQPEEEKGTGAEKVLRDEIFRDMQPDHVFALHNLPGFPLGEVVLKEGVFSSASAGIIIKLHGKSSHAAEPENGRSPSAAVAGLITDMESLPRNIRTKGFTLSTIVHASIGKKAFGVNPGFATLMATLRAYHDDDLKLMKQAAEVIVKSTAEKYRLLYEINYEEEFAATVNDAEAARIVKQAAEKAGLDVKIPTEPFRWSEDFGCFTREYKGALFGLGAGKNTPDLHNPDYDFPDELIATGMEIFQHVINKILHA